MNRYALGIAGWCLILTLGLASLSRADQNHYINTLIGDRASGMGGAYTAVSDDATGLYYNPAGIVYSTGRNLSASVNTYYVQTKKYEQVIGGQGWERESSSLLPNYFGVIQPVGSLKVGFSYAVPDSQKEDQDQVFFNLPSRFPGILATRYIINFNNEDNTYLFGPSVAMEFAGDFSAGLTLYYHQRRNQIILKQLITLANGRYESTYFNSELNESGLRPVLGVMWAPAEKFTLGLALTKTFILRSNTANQLEFKDTNYDGNTIDRTDATLMDKKKYPLQLRAGAGWFATRALLVSLDAQYSEKVSDPVFGDRVSVVNGALGAEYYLSRNWAVRGGLFTDLANTPEIQSDKTGQAENIDLYGGSLSASHFTRNTSITLGGSVSRGSGKAQVLGNDTAVQNVDAFGWMLFLSSSYTY